MKTNFKHTTAAKFLVDQAIPSEAEIDAMSPLELAKFLSENGVDVAKLNTDIPKIQAQITGKMTLAQARNNRLLKVQSIETIDVSKLTQEQIINALAEKYGQPEKIPIAARNFKSLSRQEWESLYQDLILRGSKDSIS